jgi:hypothetical protein
MPQIGEANEAYNGNEKIRAKQFSSKSRSPAQVFNIKDANGGKQNITVSNIRKISLENPTINWPF